LAIIIVGCNRSSEQATPPAANTMDNPAGAPASALATPTPLAQQSAPSPLSLPTVTPAPLAVAEPTSLPFPKRRTADGTRIEVTPVPAAPQVTCTPQGEVITCSDELLNMNFSYPAFMGRLLYTSLRKGGYTGYAYEYAFGNGESAAGGRSSDFGEGRDLMYTDNGGFDGRIAADICAQWEAALCQELGPGAVLMVLLPQTERFCADAMMATDIPRSILVLDLPQHPLINGFSFSFPLLSADAEAAFRDEWYRDAKECVPESKVELGAYLKQLHQDLAAGTAAAEIQQRYDAMIQLAKSVQSPFIAATP
jgi:hypothetical protein